MHASASQAGKESVCYDPAHIPIHSKNDQKSRLEKKTSRTDQAQQVAEEYADDQREIIKKLRKPIN